MPTKNDVQDDNNPTKGELNELLTKLTLYEIPEAWIEEYYVKTDDGEQELFRRVDVRLMENVLDEVVGPENWDYVPVSDYAGYYELFGKVRKGGMGASCSEAKRQAFASIGLGRHLYTDAALLRASQEPKEVKQAPRPTTEKPRTPSAADPVIQGHKFSDHFWSGPFAYQGKPWRGFNVPAFQKGFTIGAMQDHMGADFHGLLSKVVESWSPKEDNKYQQQFYAVIQEYMGSASNEGVADTPF